MFSRFFTQKKNVTSTIYFRHHSAGLINQVMSVELAFGLAFLENAKLHIYNSKHSEEMPIVLSGVIPPERFALYNGSANPSVFDLLELPSTQHCTLEPKDEISTQLLDKATNHNNLLQYYYRCKSGSDEVNFADMRKRLYSEAGKDMHLQDLTFGFYSRFFYQRPKALDAMLASIAFKEPYQNLAQRIAQHIGKFRGLHFRLTDHAKNYDVSKSTLARAMQYFHQRDIPLVVSTDDKDSVRELLGIPCVFIDDIIQNEFAQDFMNLPYHNEVVFGMVCLLVLSYSEEFVGTPGSTFSSYIHRLRVQRGTTEPMHYFPSGKVEHADAQGLPFSWNNSTMYTELKSWWREWPECKLHP